MSECDPNEKKTASELLREGERAVAELRARAERAEAELRERDRPVVGTGARTLTMAEAQNEAIARLREKVSEERAARQRAESALVALRDRVKREMCDRQEEAERKAQHLSALRAKGWPALLLAHEISTLLDFAKRLRYLLLETSG